jgi:hypothetical protein
MDDNSVASSNRLPVLQAQIVEMHKAVGRFQREAASAAIGAGKMLVEAKGLCGHGEWLPWLKAAGIHERTARRYMALAASNLKSDTVSDLGGITPALRFLRLRTLACQQMDEARDAHLQDRHEDEAVAVEVAIMLVHEMIALFRAAKA